VAGICGGLRVAVGSDLDAILSARAGGDDVGGKSFLLQSLREGHGIAFALDGCSWFEFPHSGQDDTDKDPALPTTKDGAP
jgi:hypothetical protein